MFDEERIAALGVYLQEEISKEIALQIPERLEPPKDSILYSLMHNKEIYMFGTNDSVEATFRCPACNNLTRVYLFLQEYNFWTCSNCNLPFRIQVKGSKLDIEEIQE